MTTFKEVTVEWRPGDDKPDIPDGAAITRQRRDWLRGELVYHSITYRVPVKPVVREVVMRGWFGPKPHHSSSLTTVAFEDCEWRCTITLIDGVPQSEVKWEKL